jgi:hypothetical protein
MLLLVSLPLLRSSLIGLSALDYCQLSTFEIGS